MRFPQFYLAALITMIAACGDELPATVTHNHINVPETPAHIAAAVITMEVNEDLIETDRATVVVTSSQKIRSGQIHLTSNGQNVDSLEFSLPGSTEYPYLATYWEMTDLRSDTGYLLLLLATDENDNPVEEYVSFRTKAEQLAAPPPVVDNDTVWNGEPPHFTEVNFTRAQRSMRLFYNLDRPSRVICSYSATPYDDTSWKYNGGIQLGEPRDEGSCGLDGLEPGVFYYFRLDARTDQNGRTTYIVGVRTQFLGNPNEDRIPANLTVELGTPPRLGHARFEITTNEQVQSDRLTVEMTNAAGQSLGKFYYAKHLRTNWSDMTEVYELTPGYFAAGTYTYTIEAFDLAGNRSTATGTVVIAN